MGVCVPRHSTSSEIVKKLGLEVGQTWFVKMPGVHELDLYEIKDLHEEVVSLHNLQMMNPRYYQIVDVKFVERAKEPRRYSGDIFD